MNSIWNDVTLHLHDGRRVSAADHLANKHVILYFTASWCQPCKQVTPVVKQLYQEMKKDDVQVEFVAVFFDKFHYMMENYYKEIGCDWAYIPLRDPAIEKLESTFNIESMPSVIVINRDGTVYKNNKDINEYHKQQATMSDLLIRWNMISNAYSWRSPYSPVTVLQ